MRTMSLLEYLEFPIVHSHHLNPVEVDGHQGESISHEHELDLHHDIGIQLRNLVLLFKRKDDRLVFRSYSCITQFHAMCNITLCEKLFCDFVANNDETTTVETDALS